MSWCTYQSTYCKIISHLCIGLFSKEGMKSLSEEWEGGGDRWGEEEQEVLLRLIIEEVECPSQDMACWAR